MSRQETGDGGQGVPARLKGWARAILRDVTVLWLAARDSRTPGWLRLLCLLVAGYALSPVDLIPDVIPVLGLLDDVILVPLGVVLCIRLMPAALREEFRQVTEAAPRTSRRTGLILLAVFWGGGLLLGALALMVAR